MTDIEPTAKDIQVIQGLVARGYAHMKTVCHFVLEVQDRAKAKAFLVDLIEKKQITTAESWGDRATWPTSCLNVGFTFAGLSAMGLDSECKKMSGMAELEAFAQGAVARADRVGDSGRSAPDQWIGCLAETNRVHVLLSLYACNGYALNDRRKELRTAFYGSFNELSAHEGAALNEKGDLVHFGFRDGIAQPNIAGMPDRKNPKDGGQPKSEAGAFLLGYPSQFSQHTYEFDFPSDLARNGTFAAFRILEQDVAGFEQFLDDEAKRKKVEREKVAGMMCGRYRNGKPLVAPGASEETINDFGYSGDRHGEACPFSAHIRRSNPRDDKIAANVGSKHRIIRRGMPYGPLYDPAKPDDQPRGLLGLFLCVSLRDQFEFIMKNWINRGGFQGNLPASDTDPLVGKGGFVYTRGGAYCFLPSIDGLKYIAAHL